MPSSGNVDHTTPYSLASSSSRTSPGPSKRSRSDLDHHPISPNSGRDERAEQWTRQQDQWSDIDVHASHTPEDPTRPHNTGRDNLKTKRREANRLAAQRFRSRRKGYQESLEEKVRDLQEDNVMLLRRLETQAGPLPPIPGQFHAQPGDIRFTALDSANRQLRDENRALEAELRRLSSEVEMWRSWAQRHREGSRWPDAEQVRSCTNTTLTQSYQSHPALPLFPHRPSSFSDMRRASSSAIIIDSHIPSLPPPNPPASPLGIRLPPIRLSPPRLASPLPTAPPPCMTEPSALASSPRVSTSTSLPN